jgi:hypothetical protein
MFDSREINITAMILCNGGQYGLDRRKARRPEVDAMTLTNLWVNLTEGLCENIRR